MLCCKYCTLVGNDDFLDVCNPTEVINKMVQIQNHVFRRAFRRSGFNLGLILDLLLF